MNDNKILRILHAVENNFAYFVLIFLALIPTGEVIARKIFNSGLPSSDNYTQHLVLWITFLGGIITSKENKHLALTAGLEMIKKNIKDKIIIATSTISSSITFAFAWSSLSMVLIGFDSTRTVGIFPIKIIAFIMPIGYTIIAIRFITGAPGEKIGKIITSLGIIIGTLLSFSTIINLLGFYDITIPGFIDSFMQFTISASKFFAIPLIIFLIAAGLLGTPIFAVLGGIAYMLFIRSDGSLEVISNEAYTVLISHSIPAIPLFAFVGFILSESNAGERLMKLFRSLFGWLPGGQVIMVILVCAFFTTFTGASGVTILALGGLLSYVLIQSGKYPEDFTYGLLTASGSIGLLFPPSLPIILYGVVAQISIKKMFIGGIVPGIVMIVTLSIFGIYISIKNKVERVPFDVKDALVSIKNAIWEILLPVIILLGFFGGLFTIVETGAIAVVYSLILTMIIHKDIKIKDLPEVMKKCLPIIGGILIILAMSRGLSYYIVDAEIPMELSAWVKANIHSKIVFLILLNILLLITGCLMDIFSAIMVVVPLIIPLGEIFGIHPVHLGIIFLANLELGYLTPPVGLNLFLASYRFEKPLGTIYKYAIPFFIVMLIALLIITYIPSFSTGLL